MASCASRIENTIRRVAGTLVLASLALGYWVHPGWFLFTGFVGLNLLQSSFTGFCPLEMILQKTMKEGAAETARG